MLIRSSSHSVKFANTYKKDILNEFLTEYNRVKWELVDYFWNTKITWNNKTLDIKNNKLDCPNFISTTNIPIKTNLSARALKLASGEALAIIDSQIAKRRRQLYILSLRQNSKLQSKIDSNPLVKPTSNNKLWANLDSNCCEYIPTQYYFNGFLKLKCLGKNYGHIYIPIKQTRHSNKLKKDFVLMTSWNISNTQVTSRWQKESIKSNGTITLGADQGVTTCLSLSDGQSTTKNKDGYDLKSIMDKLNNKKKGSKSYKRTQEHRTNYINWSINQLNLDNVKELRLEKLFQMRSGTRTSSFMNRWTYTQINTSIRSKCEILGVPVIEQSATYRSQRCSDCA